VQGGPKSRSSICSCPACPAPQTSCRPPARRSEEYPVSGSDDFDTITLQQINDHTVQATLKKSGKVVSTARRVVAKDGKMMTLTITGTNAKGQKMKNTAVYEKL
jgi:hypothetical protein